MKFISGYKQLNDEELNSEVAELPKRAILEISLSELKTKKKYDLLKKSFCYIFCFTHFMKNWNIP